MSNQHVSHEEIMSIAEKVMEQQFEVLRKLAEAEAADKFLKNNEYLIKDNKDQD